MISKDNNFKRNLFSIKKTLESRENMSLEFDVFKKCIEEKLDNSLNYYYSNLMKNCSYILQKNPLTMIKDLNQMLTEEEND